MKVVAKGWGGFWFLECFFGVLLGGCVVRMWIGLIFFMRILAFGVGFIVGVMGRI